MPVALMELAGKRVLVTGAAKRIGLEIANRFDAKGAEVLVHYRSSRPDPRFRSFQADLSRIGSIKKMAEKILKSGGVDILVNNASVFYRTPFGKTKESEWDDLLDTNLKAPFFLAQALAPGMKKAGGRIINIADWAGLRPYRDYLPYCISKAGLITMTQGLAKTLGPKVLVTAVCPGPILPPATLSKKEKNRAAGRTLVGRWGNPDDIARMVVFLAEQDFVTGSYHLVDGGEFLKG